MKIDFSAFKTTNSYDCKFLNEASKINPDI